MSKKFSELAGSQSNAAEIAGKLLAGLQVFTLQVEAMQSAQSQAVEALESVVCSTIESIRLVHGLTQEQVEEASGEFMPDVLIHHFNAKIEQDGLAVLQVAA